MSLHVVFLRAINVGSRRVKMADLRGAFADGGFVDVSTHIASGNVIVSNPSPPLPSDIEQLIETAFGFGSMAFVRSSAEIEEILANVPWTDEDGSIDVSLLEGLPSPGRVEVLEATAVPPEKLIVRGREAYFLRVGGGGPTVHKETVTARVLDMETTRRGIRTIRAIHDKYLTQEG